MRRALIRRRRLNRRRRRPSPRTPRNTWGVLQLETPAMQAANPDSPPAELLNEGFCFRIADCMSLQHLCYKV
ncbi:hypothetical protein RR46_00624 [Papilio xuthus]|uniref:Uncharacterized protein n=1 Tax=Papilio xuthus TaxID=66420 RepID=A0A0N1IB41_PAPXU|nr:hypothetical protein RR46_00624 [Papilio xuthus]